jgi:hypothetical protein
MGVVCCGGWTKLDLFSGRAEGRKGLLGASPEEVSPLAGLPWVVARRPPAAVGCSVWTEREA